MSFRGRVSRWARSAGGSIILAPPATRAAAAHRVTGGAGVSLARRLPSAASAPPAFGFGPPLEPFTYDAAAPGWWDRSAAMTLPTIKRARDLIVTAVAALPFTYWQTDPTAVPIVERRQPLRQWHVRPDPVRTRQWLLAWTVDDLMFYEAAHWEITARLAPSSGSWPSAFRRIAPGTFELDASGLIVTIDDEWGRRRIAATEIVEFLSPVQGLLSCGYRSISIALQLDAAADRFAAMEVPAGVLEEQDNGGEDLSADELGAHAETFAMARQLNTIAAVNKHMRYREIPTNANDLQLVEARTFQALELSRLGNVPPYLTGAPAGTGMTYLNGQQSRQDLIDFGALPFIGCIEQTLSADWITPRGTATRLDVNAWLRNPFTTPAQGVASPNDMQIADPSADTTLEPQVVPT